MADTRSTLLRGPDGAMYVIPCEQLEQFLVPEEQAAEVRQTIRSRQKEGEVRSAGSRSTTRSRPARSG